MLVAVKGVLRQMACAFADLIGKRGTQKMIVSGNEAGLTSAAVLAQFGNVGVRRHYVALGKAPGSGSAVIFDSRKQDEFFNETMFSIV